MKPLPQPVIDRMRRLSQVHTLEVVADLCRVTKTTVQRARQRGWLSGSGGRRRRPMPSDYPIQRHYMRVHELRVHYATGLCCIRRWEAELAEPRRFVAARGAPPKLAAPHDLVETVERLGVGGAVRHYGISENTLQRMREEAGLPVHRRAGAGVRKARAAAGARP